jgi:hypothetical protein
MSRSSNKSVQSIQLFMAANYVIREGLFRWRCTDTIVGYSIHYSVDYTAFLWARSKSSGTRT